MSTSSLGLNLHPSTVVPSLAALLGVFQIANGTYALMNPAAAAANFGLSNSSPVVASAKSNPFIKVVAGRAISAGLGMVALAYLRYNRALGVLMTTGIVTGTIDAVTLLNQVDSAEEKSVPDGEKKQKAQQAAMGHFGIPAVCAAIGAWILVTT